MTRRRLLRLAALLASTLAGVLACELALRASPPRAGFSSEAVFGRFDPVLGWTNREGATGRYRDPFTPALEYGITIDPHGRRSRGPRAGDRVAVLGDSLAFGHGVEDSECFPALLERPGREVLNFGTCGYGLGQIVLRLEREALPLAPRVVVLALIRDDLRRATEEWAPNGFPRPRFRLAGEQLLDPAGELPSPLAAGAPLPRPGFLVGRALTRAFVALEAHARGVPRESLEEPWLLGRALLRRAFERSHGARFVVAILPEPREVTSSEDAPERTLIAALGRELGFAVVDLVPAFREAGRTERVLIPGDGHPNARGHALIARALEPHLR